MKSARLRFAEHSSLTGSATLPWWFSPRRIEEHSTGQRDRVPCSRGQLRVEVHWRRLWNVLSHRTPLWQMCMVLVDQRRSRHATTQIGLAHRQESSRLQRPAQATSAWFRPSSNFLSRVEKQGLPRCSERSIWPRLLQDTKAQWTAIHQHMGTAPPNMICIEPRLIQGHLLWTQTVSTYQGKAHRAGWRDRLGRHNFMRSQNGISLALRTNVQERTGSERPAQDLPRPTCGARGSGSLRTRHCVSCALRAL